MSIKLAFFETIISVFCFCFNRKSNFAIILYDYIRNMMSFSVLDELLRVPLYMNFGMRNHESDKTAARWQRVGNRQENPKIPCVGDRNIFER